MKTKTINVYEFSELSDKAKENAISNYITYFEYGWGDEAIKSVEAFCEHFGCTVNNYSIDFLEPNRNNFSISYAELEDGEIESLLNELGDYNKDTFKGLGDCKLTGVCFDEDVIDGFRTAWFNGERDLRELISEGISEWESSVRSDAEYQISEEGFADHCDCNNIEFNKEGEMI